MNSRYGREMNPQEKRPCGCVGKKFGTRGNPDREQEKNSTRTMIRREMAIFSSHQCPRPNPKRKEKIIELETTGRNPW